MTTITEAQVLDLQPIGTVVRDSHGHVYVLEANGSDHAWVRPGRLGGTLPEFFGFPATVLHDPTQPAPAGVTDREAVDVAIGAVLFNASNYPERVQVHILGQDTGPLRTKVTDAVLAALPGRTVAQVKAEALTEFRATVADLRRVPGGSRGPTVKGCAGSYRREAVERFVAWILSDDFETTLAEVVVELEREDGR